MNARFAPALVLVLAAATAWASPTSQVIDKAWDGNRAMNDIAAQLSFTPRAIGTRGHEQTIQFIRRQLKKNSRTTVLQRWNYQAADGQVEALENIIVHLNPQNPRRVILGTHYDSIIRAYRDPDNPSGLMPGANNSASGVALLLETARALTSLPPPPVGVDLVFFDGEEGPKALGAGDPEWMALGSPYFAQHLAALYPGAKPVGGLVFDMVCYKDLKLRPELNSTRSAKAEVERFWDIGHELAPSVFVTDSMEGSIGDDQIALTDAGIPSFLVIDIRYEPWFNTTKDTLDKCSRESLGAVGRTVLRYLYSL